MRQQSLEKVIKNILDDKNSLPTVAVSGGIDSLSLAVFISKLYITKKINIAHAIGPAVPREATNRVKTLAKEYNWNLKNGKKEGKQELWYENGNIKYILYYKNGN